MRAGWRWYTLPMSSLSPARLVDAVLEGTVVGSFTKIGPSVRRRLDKWQPLPRLDGKTVVVTGATSGLGRAASIELAHLGATVEVVGRDEQRAADVVAEIAGSSSPTGTPKATARIGDVSSLSGVRALADQLASTHDHLHAVVHCAGAMFEQRRETGDGIEATWATMVVGPHLLTRLLAERTERAVWVSSGGMYTQRVELDDIEWQWRKWSGSKAYAQAKRAQVDLVAEATERGEAPQQHAMHPGWAATPGVETSLPGFDKVMGPLLRDPADGADTMVWLVAAPSGELTAGGFYHDRRLRNTVRWPGTGTSAPDRDRLRALVDRQAKLG